MFAVPVSVASSLPVVSALPAAEVPVLQGASAEVRTVPAASALPVVFVLPVAEVPVLQESSAEVQALFAASAAEDKRAASAVQVAVASVLKQAEAVQVAAAAEPVFEGSEP